MITTKTGAKKLEANDNWAKIVPNAQGQDSAHNDSVEAHDSAIESLCQTISGTTNNCGHTINAGEFFIANGGKYKATATIPVNGAWSGSAQAVSDNDLINALNNSLTSKANRIESVWNMPVSQADQGYKEVARISVPSNTVKLVFVQLIYASGRPSGVMVNDQKAYESEDYTELDRGCMFMVSQSVTTIVIKEKIADGGSSVYVGRCVIIY